MHPHTVPRDEPHADAAHCDAVNMSTAPRERERGAACTQASTVGLTNIGLPDTSTGLEPGWKNRKKSARP
jgi:hypothetical protein